MFNQKDLAIFLEKVPELRNRRTLILIGLYLIALSMACILFFWLVNRQASYAPLISHLVIALVIVLLEFFHLRTAKAYRKRDGILAYQVHFYHLMLPILVTWYACCFHLLFISGPALLPPWLAVDFGILALTCMALALALLHNNVVALLAAALVLIPTLATGYMEDQELRPCAQRKSTPYTAAFKPKSATCGRWEKFSCSR